MKERRGRCNLRPPRGSSFLRPLSARGLSDWPKRLCDKVGRLKKPTEGRTPGNQTSSESASGLDGGREGGREESHFSKIKQEAVTGSLDMTVCCYFRSSWRRRRLGGQTTAMSQPRRTCSALVSPFFVYSLHRRINESAARERVVKACAGLLLPRPQAASRRRTDGSRRTTLVCVLTSRC